MGMVNIPGSGNSRALQLLFILIAGLVPILLIGSNWVVGREFEENRELRDAAARSYETRHTLQALLNFHLDLETSGRGFVITRNKAFLDPYYNAGREMDHAFGTLSTSPTVDPISGVLLGELRSVSREKRAFVRTTVDRVLEGRPEEAERMIATGKGKQLMDTIRVLIDRLEAVEQQVLDQRIADAEKGRERLGRLTMMLQTGLLLLLFIGALIGLRINAARGRALVRMRASSARQAAIFDSASDGMMMLDRAGRIQSLNPAASSMFGYAPEEMKGRTVAMLYKDVPTQEQTDAFLRAVDVSRGNARQAQDFIGRRKDGVVFPTEVAVSVVGPNAGQDYLAVVRDITARKQVERMKSEFVSVVSHELRTPLTSIAGSLGLLAGGAAGELPEAARKLVSIAESNSTRLVRLVNDILDVEKIEAGKMAFAIAPVPLAPVIDQCVQANAAFAAQFDVSIVVDDVPADVAVMADSDRLMQVMTNLLSNAAKFSPPGEDVRVSVTPGVATHRISVAGLGPGIPDNFRDRIFQKFAQADASDTRQKGGTGLGLSIVAEIVARLNGRVSFDSAPGHGATFHVDLPSAPLAVPASQETN